jgi:Protein of unknown function (DUF4232)
MPGHVFPHPRRRGRRAATVLAVVAAAGVCLTAFAAPAATAAAPTRCTVPQLRGSLTNFSAGAGQRYATLVLRNASRRSCTMFGYPGALLLASNGRALPTNVVRDRSVRPRTIVVRPGGRATSQWHWSVIPGVGEQHPGRCEPPPARVEVTPPNDFSHLVLPWRSGPVCEHGTITVRPMRLG